MSEHERMALTDAGPTMLGLLSRRFSPARFDADHVVSDAVVDVLLAAAGRAPSAGNSQPWAFILGRRGDPVHGRLVPYLAGSTARWAAQAGLLIANLAHVLVEGSDMEFSEFARYDLGQAVAHLTVQAEAFGLSVHQFRAFDREGVAAEFGVPAHWEVTSMAAVGVPDAVRPLTPPPGAVGSTSRERRPIGQITWARHR
jgi:nitroreductase